jgi:hypothetical protein
VQKPLLLSTAIKLFPKSDNPCSTIQPTVPNLTHIYHKIFAIDDIVHEILMFLCRTDIINVILTCRYMFNLVECVHTWIELINRDCVERLCFNDLNMVKSIADIKQFYRLNRWWMRPAQKFIISHAESGVLSLSNNRFWCYRNPVGCIFERAAYLIDSESILISISTVIKNKGNYRVQWRYLLDDGFWLEDLECGVEFQSVEDGNNVQCLWSDEDRIRFPIYHWYYLTEARGHIQTELTADRATKFTLKNTLFIYACAKHNCGDQEQRLPRRPVDYWTP